MQYRKEDIIRVGVKSRTREGVMHWVAIDPLYKRAFFCTCEGYTHRRKCRHLQEAEDYIYGKGGKVGSQKVVPNREQHGVGVSAQPAA